MQAIPSHLKYLASFYLPVCVAIFLYTGPHQAATALLWTTPLWLLILADFFCPKINPYANKKIISHYFYDSILYILAVLQFVLIVLLLVYASKLQWATLADSTTSLVNMLVLRILLGTTSGSSAIIVAHELLHRRRWHLRFIGRLLMLSVCYEHFIIAHHHHHQTAATPADISTAQDGESFRHYLPRVVAAQFHYAWQQEATRLQHSKYRLLTNGVLQGILVEFAIIITVLLAFGWAALVVFLLQAAAAISLLESINYYQHWGLANQDRALAWTNQSSISEYALIGLSNHASHHQNANTSFQQTLYTELGPKMPHGYFVSNLWVKLHNASYRKIANEQLGKFFQTRSLRG